MGFFNGGAGKVTGNRGFFFSLQILLEHGTSLILNFANC
jgi:hypothetical protein